MDNYSVPSGCSLIFAESKIWVEGNVKIGKSCFLCKEPVTTLGPLGFRCSRCKLVVN